MYKFGLLDVDLYNIRVNVVAVVCLDGYLCKHVRWAGTTTVPINTLYIANHTYSILSCNVNLVIVL